MAWKRQSDPTRYKKGQMVLAVVLLLLIIIASFVAWRLVKNEETEVNTTPIEASETEKTGETVEEKEPQFDSGALQSTVDEWVNSTSGTSSVVVSDSNGNILAAYNADQVYFAASLYKLYVAYEGYRQLDAGEVDPNEIYINVHTREECLDLMIRESDSPCAEKLWDELGKLELTNKLREYGITNTSMTNISTTAQDTSVMLAMIARGEGLSEESQAKYLDSMKTQDDLYRRGLPSGFSDAVIVYNKVGWNEQIEWHDATIVELSDGRRIIVSVLTENVGTANIRKLAESLESVILNN